MAEEDEVNEHAVIYGTTDVFHDLGLENADELLANAKLAIALDTAMSARKLSPTEAIGLMGGDQPKDSTTLLNEVEKERFIEAVRKGLQDAEYGKGRPAEMVFAEMKARYGL